MKNYLCMAVLALAGTIMSGCSNDDNYQQPANVNNVVTLTTTVGLGGGTTRALTEGGVKTFAKDEQMAIVYKNTAGQTVKAVSEALTDGDIAEGSHATFTFTLTDPDREVPVRYIYPAAMAKETIDAEATIDDAGTVDYGKLATQDGTLDNLSSTLDLATYDGAWVGGKLPGGTLENRLAILACTIKKHAGNDITSSITSMTVSDGTNTYTVERDAAEGPIYVAIRPTDNATINVTATNATRTYYKTLTAKTYEASNGYPVSWKMDLPVLNLETYWDGEYTVTEDMVITGSGGCIIKTDGSHEITLDNVNLMGMGNIDLDLSSSMTIKLKGENRLNHIIGAGTVLYDVTIYDAGRGTLIAINDNNPLTGNFTIYSGIVKAKATMDGYAVAGSLIVNGGAVYLAGGGGERAVQYGIDGNVTVYGWTDSSWQLGWGYQYITTDISSGDPTAPGNSNWNW